MNDNEIIKTLECCIMETYCKSCPLRSEFSANCVNIAFKNAFALITRQQAEIERLKKGNSKFLTREEAERALKIDLEE